MNVHDRSELTRRRLGDYERLSLHLAFLLLTISFSSSAFAQAITVSVSPEVASVETGGSLNVSATVQNDSSNQGVTWVLTGDGTSCKRLSNTPVRQAGAVLKCLDAHKNRVISAQATYPCGSSGVGG